MKKTATKNLQLRLVLVILLLNSTLTQNSLRTAESDTDQMVRVEKLVDLTQDYQLTVATAWQPLSDLKNTFELTFSQHVGITIRISIFVNTACRMKLRVMIDGVENKALRRQVAQTKFIVFLGNDFVWLNKGKHNISLQYIKTGGEQTIQNNRVNMAFFKLDYLYKKPVPKQSKTLLTETLFPFSLSNTNTYQPFPNLVLNFTLDSKREVLISYKTMVYFQNGNPSHIATRLFIDGKQHRSFRYHTGNVFVAVNLASGIVELQAGQHIVMVDYRTPGNVVSNERGDWNTNQLRVKY